MNRAQSLECAPRGCPIRVFLAHRAGQFCAIGIAFCALLALFSRKSKDFGIFPVGMFKAQIMFVVKPNNLTKGHNYEIDQSIHLADVESLD